MRIGSTLQILSFEVGLGCDLCTIHPQCPNALGRDRYVGRNDHRLTDELIADVAWLFYHDFDFRGWINFSFYNEPTLRPLGALVSRIRHWAAPECKLMLITNGQDLPARDSVLMNTMRMFDWISITDYGGDESPDPERLQALIDVCGQGRWTPDPRGVFVNKGKLDRRMTRVGGDRSDRPCVYPFKDLAIDYFGNIHLCCYDWRGTVQIGNVITDGVGACLENWERVVRTIAGHRMTEDAPQTCRVCPYKGFQRLEKLNQAARSHASRWIYDELGKVV